MSSVVLPEGWCNACLDDVATWGSGGTPSRKNIDFYGGDIPWVKTGDLGARILTEASEFITKEAIANSSAKVFRKGSVVMAMYGATIGRTSILGIDATTNQACAVGSPVASVTTTEFLYYFLSSEKNAFIAKGKGGAQPNISQALIREHGIALPPLAEQKVIADKLDSLLAQVDNIKNRLDALPTIIKRFKQSVLSAAVSGKLTEEWRGGNSKKWDIKKLAEVCKSISDGDHQAPPRAESGIPFLVISNVSSGVINLDNVERYVPYDYYLNLKDIRKPELHDVLYTVTGSFGIPVVVRTTSPFCFQRHIAILKPNPDKVDYRFLNIILSSNNAYQQADLVATGTAQKTVPLSGLRAFEFEFPSLSEQTEIVRRVEQLFAYADQIEQQVKNAQNRVNNLTQSILAKAFRGELTTDWRAANPHLISGENSAQALLAKIKAERDKPKKTSKQQAMFNE